MSMFKAPGREVLNCFVVNKAASSVGLRPKSGWWMQTRAQPQLGSRAMTGRLSRRGDLFLGLWGIFLCGVLFPHQIDFISVVRSFSLLHVF